MIVWCQNSRNRKLQIKLQENTQEQNHTRNLHSQESEKKSNTYIRHQLADDDDDETYHKVKFHFIYKVE